MVLGRRLERRRLASVRAQRLVLDVLVNRHVQRLRLAPPAHLAEQRAPLLRAARRGRHVHVGRLADPALAVGAIGTELADEMALPTGGQIGLGALAFEDRAPADVAGHVVVGGAKFLLHGGVSSLAAGPAGSAELQGYFQMLVRARASGYAWAASFSSVAFAITF